MQTRENNESEETESFLRESGAIAIAGTYDVIPLHPFQ